MTIAEYLRFDDETPGKHEYFAGKVVAMAGGSSYHSAIAFNLSVAIGRRIAGTNCQGHTSDLRVGIPCVPSFSYPDMSVVCGPPQFDPRDPRENTVTNPKLVAEILSPSTEQIDRGRKFENYLRLESLQEYVLVSQDQPLITSYYRQPDGTWGAFAFATGLQDVLKLRSLSIEIPLSEIFANVVFPPVDGVHGQ